MLKKKRRSKRKKCAIELEKLIEWAIAIIIFVLILLFLFYMKGSGDSVLGRIKNILRFG